LFDLDPIDMARPPVFKVKTRLAGAVEKRMEDPMDRSFYKATSSALKELLQ
jgi:hypothetical protein